MLSCEDATIDYASDIVGDYKVETTTIDGIYTDYSILPLELAWIIQISKDNLVYFLNDLNQCDTSYLTPYAREIKSISDSTIIFSDNTSMTYTIRTGGLTLTMDGDIINAANYDGSFPPAVWTDPTLLTNDAYEPDGSLSQATMISAAGAVQTHYSAVCDDDDYYIFEALIGTRYIIEAEAEAGSDIDLTISLYSLSGDRLAYSDDQSTSNVDPKVVWTCPDSADYYFVVKKYWDYLDPGNSLDDERGAYTVSVDVTKALLKTPPQGIIKHYRPVQATHQLHKFFD